MLQTRKSLSESLMAGGQMDPLADRISFGGVRGTLMANVLAADPWGIRLNAIADAVFHGVTAGACWLRIEGEPPRHLFAGDVVLLAHGTQHTLASAAAGPARRLDRLTKDQMLTGDGELRLCDAEPTTQILCATYREEDAGLHPLLRLLPDVVIIRAEAPDAALGTLLRMMRVEQRHAGLGTRAVLDRLVDVLLVYVIREWLQTLEHAPPSWLAALRDPVVAEVIGHLHADAAKPWTVDGLAAKAGVSRATLGRKFTALVGESPSAYLTRWRLHVAARMLRTGDDSVGRVARAVGYTSEYAFSRAFSRAWGVPPGRYRRAHRESTPAPAAS